MRGEILEKKRIEKRREPIKGRKRLTRKLALEERNSVRPSALKI